MIERAHLQRNGYALLRGAIPVDWLEALRQTFENRVTDQWPVPRGRDWRHALLDLDPQVRQVCRLPAVLAVAGALIGERYFLAQVEGREPRMGGGHQTLHRDFSAERPGDTVNALAFLDDYGPDNGATRLVPGSHRMGAGEPIFDFSDESRAQQLTGSAGDILVFDADLVHGASLNRTGAHRRSLLIGYFAEPRHASHLKTAHLRQVRMEPCEWFDPPALGA